MTGHVDDGGLLGVLGVLRPRLLRHERPQPVEFVSLLLLFLSPLILPAKRADGGDLKM